MRSGHPDDQLQAEVAVINELLNQFVQPLAVVFVISVGLNIAAHILRMLTGVSDEPVRDTSRTIIARPISEIPKEDVAPVHYTINAKTPPPEPKKEKDRCAYCGGRTRNEWTNCRNCGAPL